MDKNKSLMLASVVFGLMALMHLIRAVLGLEAVIAGFKVPIWLSYVFFVAAGYLAWHMHSAGKK